MDKSRPTYNQKHNCTCVFLYTSRTTIVWTTDNKEIKKNSIHNLGLDVVLFNTHLQNELVMKCKCPLISSW